MFPPYYVINLDTQPERWQRMEKVSQFIGRPITRIPAASPSEFKNKSYFSEQLQRPLSFPEIGCFYSHRKVWEKILSGPSPYAFVFEDDAVISPKITTLEDFLNKESFSFDIVHIENPRKGPFFLTDRNSIKDASSIKLFRLLSQSVGAAGLAISKRGAEKLLQVTEPFAPVDEIMLSKYSKIWKNLLIYQTNPVLVWQLDEFKSNLPSSLMSTIDNTTGKRQFNFAANILKLFKKIDYLAYLTKFKKEKIKLDYSEKEVLKDQLFL